jgi:phospholipid transport system substrate-binding protein
MPSLRPMRTTAALGALLCALLLASLDEAAHAAAADPAVEQVRTLSDALLRSMRAGSAESMTERYRSLEPVIERVFALPLVTRLAVGPDWAGFAPEQQQALIAAFTRFTVANYAYNFRSFDGQKFEVDDDAVSRAPDKIVRSRIIPAGDTPVSLLYRMHEVDGTWKVIDVYSDGVSSLALRRSDFAAALAAGGAPALLTYLGKASDALMK